MKVLSLEVALYLYKSSIQPCTKCCCHLWASAPTCYLEILNKLIAAFLEPLVQCVNIASLSLFHRYYFSRCSSVLAQLVSLPYSCGRSTRYSEKLHNSSVTIPRCYKDFYVNSFFFLTQLDSEIFCLWNAFFDL